MIFRFTFSGTDYFVAMAAGVSGWNLIYNAVGDPALAIEAALAQLATLGGGTLRIKGAGQTWITQSTINSQGAEVTWESDLSLTIQAQDGLNAHMLSVTHSGFRMRGVSFDNNKANQVGNFYTAMFTTVTDCEIDRCRFEGSPDNAIRFTTNCHRNKLLDSYFVDCGYEDLAAHEVVIFTGTCTYNRIQGNIVNRDSNEHGAGIQIGDGCIHCVITENIVIGGGTQAGSQTDSISVGDSDHAVVTDNIIVSAGLAAIDMAQSEHSLVDGNVIDGVVDGDGVHLAAGNYYLTISDNVILDVGGTAAINEPNPDSYDLTIIGNTIVGCAVSAISTDATRTKIVGNTIVDPIGSAIIINDGNCCTILDNTIRNGGGVGVRVQGSAEDTLIDGNLFDTLVSSAIIIFAATCLRTKVGENNRYVSIGTNNIVNDLGTGSIFPCETFKIDEIDGGAELVVTPPTGVLVDAAGEIGLTWNSLKESTQQIIKMVIRGVATDGPINVGGYMRAEFTFNAGAMNFAYNTAAKSWNLPNFNGEDVDYVADDGVHWEIRDADVGNELRNGLRAEDIFELLCIFAAGVDPDGDTACKFRSLEIYYV